MKLRHQTISQPPVLSQSGNLHSPDTAAHPNAVKHLANIGLNLVETACVCVCAKHALAAEVRGRIHGALVQEVVHGCFHRQQHEVRDVSSPARIRTPYVYERVCMVVKV